MGEVFSAQDTELGRTVALKFLLPDAFESSSTVESFIREAKAASSLNHPNIVTVHEVIRSESSRAIVMELVEGASLRELCGSAQPIDLVIRTGQQIANALAEAHVHGIVHRDVKPENIMVRGDGYVKVLDFGLARQMAVDTAGSGLPAGTLRYMSPEQIRGEPLTGASDVFSLGLTLYELLTGSHPFESSSAFETAVAIARRRAASGVAVERVRAAAARSASCSACMAKDPGSEAVRRRDRPNAGRNPEGARAGVN